MDERDSKVSFKRSVKVLLKLYQCLGLVNFTYNRFKNRVELSTHKSRILSSVLCGCASLSIVGILSVILIFGILYSTMEDEYVVQWEAVVLVTQSFMKVSNSLIFTINIVMIRGVLVETLNSIFGLSERVRRLTNDGSLYYPSRFQKFIKFRQILFLANCLQNSCNKYVWKGILFCFWFGQSFALMELIFWTHFYGNLVLLCFYLKMNRHLDNLWTIPSNRKIKRCIRKAIKISYEIHRMKHKFNSAFTTLHVICFFGLFTDIGSLYELIRLSILVMLNKMYLEPTKIVQLLSSIFFLRSWASLDLFLQGYMADALIQSENSFRLRLLIIFHGNDFLKRDPHQQREIDLVLLHHKVRDLTTRSLRVFVLNRRFLFSFLMNIVISYAIVMFQQFANDYLSSSGERLSVLQLAVFHNITIQTNEEKMKKVFLYEYSHEPDS